MSSNAADYIGDYEFAIDITLEIEQYLKSKPSNFDSWFNFYHQLGSFYDEIDDINSSIKSFQKAVEHYDQKISSKSSIYLNDSYLKEVYEKTRKKIAELQSITDFEGYKLERNTFRANLLSTPKAMENDENLLLDKKSELEDFAYAIEIEELNALQVAFLSILKNDKDASNSIFFTSEVYKEMEDALMKYHEVAETDVNQDFSFTIDNIDFPTSIKNNWAIIFSPSEGFELYKVHFNRYDRKEIELIS